MEKRFGNWIVNQNGIELDGELYKNIEYNIYMNKLLEIGHSERKGLYNWLIHISEKKWIRDEDVKSLNEAFLFACQEFELNLDWDLYENTLERQLLILEKRKQ